MVYRTLEYLYGISDSDVRRLRAVGIHHTNQLLHRTSLEIDRKRLAKKTGITNERLFEFVNQCALRDDSALERWIDLMSRFAISTMKDLPAHDAGQLHSRRADATGLHCPL